MPTPELDAYERQLSARSHRKVLYTVVGCLVLVAPLVVLFLLATVPDVLYKLKHPLRGVSPATQAIATASAASARAAALREEEAARAGIDAAIAQALDPHPELGECPKAGLARTLGDDGFRRTSDSHVCAACDSAMLSASLLEGARAERSREPGLDDRLVRRAAALDREAGALGTVVIAHVTAEAAAHGAPHAGFTPGQVRGRAYLWDTSSHRVLCVGDFEAESSEAIDYKYMTRGPLEQGGTAELQAALARDLAERTRTAVYASLRYRAGPHIVD